MLDFAIFRSSTSAGSNLVAFVVTLAMFASFFFLTLYMQNVLHYSPLQTGLRILPATILIIIMGPIAGRLTDRIGPRPPMVVGLVILSAALGIQSQITLRTGYGLLLPGFILMGMGIGLVLSPMNTAAMNAVDRRKAGAASGVLSMSRMVGGSVGLSLMGALVTTVGRSKLDSSLPHVAATVRGKLASALASGSVPTGRQTSPTIVHATHSAFVSALGVGLSLGAAVTLAGALLAAVLIRPTHSPTQQPTVEEVLPDERTAAEVAAT
jgi:MFS family permease